MKIMITIALLALSTTSASANATILRDERVGGVVSNKETGEELYFSCVEKNADDLCVSYRFISQIGNEPRVLGNHAIEPYEVVQQRYFKHRFYQNAKYAHVLKWWGKQCQDFYDENDEGIEVVQVLTCFIIPPSFIVAVPTVVAIEAVRTVISLPVQTVKHTVKSIQAKKLNRAFGLMFSGSGRNEKLTLRPERFVELKKTVLKLSTQNEVKPANN